MATAPKVPKEAKDEESGYAKIFDPTRSRSSTPDSTSLDIPDPKKRMLANTLAPEEGGKRKKSRKQKKRVNKKTQKRRGRK
jgi:hypothetical protein